MKITVGKKKLEIDRNNVKSRTKLNWWNIKNLSLNFEQIHHLEIQGTTEATAESSLPQYMSRVSLENIPKTTETS